MKGGEERVHMIQPHRTHLWTFYNETLILHRYTRGKMKSLTEDHVQWRTSSHLAFLRRVTSICSSGPRNRGQESHPGTCSWIQVEGQSLWKSLTLNFVCPSVPQQLPVHSLISWITCFRWSLCVCDWEVLLRSNDCPHLKTRKQRTKKHYRVVCVY